MNECTHLLWGAAITYTHCAIVEATQKEAGLCIPAQPAPHEQRHTNSISTRTKDRGACFTQRCRRFVTRQKLSACLASRLPGPPSEHFLSNVVAVRTVSVAIYRQARGGMQHSRRMHQTRHQKHAHKALAYR